MARIRLFGPPSRNSTQYPNAWRSRWVDVDSSGRVIGGDEDSVVYYLDRPGDLARLKVDAAAECRDKDLIDWLATEYIKAQRGDDPMQLFVTARALSMIGDMLEGTDDE